MDGNEEGEEDEEEMMLMEIHRLCTYNTIYNLMHTYIYIPKNGLVIPKIRPVTYYSQATGKMIS